MSKKQELPTLGKDGYYRINVSYNGRRYPVRSKTIQGVYEKAATKRKLLEDGVLLANGNTTVRQWAQEWLSTYHNGDITPKVYANYAQLIRDTILPEVGNFHIKDVKPVHLQRILNSQAGKSRSHINKVSLLLNQIFRSALYNGMILQNPADGLHVPKGTAGSHRSITPYEREVCLRVAQEHVAGLWIKTMLYTGIRPGETAALLWTDIDWSRKIIHITKALESGSKTIKQPKTPAGIRDVPIPDILLLDLKEASKQAKSEFVFTQQTRPVRHTTQSLQNYWKSFLRAVDIAMGAKVYRNQIIEHKVAPDLVPYCFRHTYCTDLQDAGVPINVARYLMGHSDISVTAKIYTHQTEYSTMQALDAINARISGAKDAETGDPFSDPFSMPKTSQKAP